MQQKILLIDDDQLVCTSLKKILVKFDYIVEICNNAEEAADMISDFQPDIILLDIYLTTHNGLDLLKNFRKRFSHIPVIMITGYSDVKIAVTAMKSGAFDFLLKPIDLDQLKSVLSKASENIRLKTEVDKLHAIIKGDELSPDFFGKSKKIRQVINSVEKLAKSSDTTILLEGESGTGKEGFAKYVHQLSPRKDAPFIQVNCAAIPKELAESEFFGYEKGAFTGANQKTKLGKFELAAGGTILLDEIAELTPDLQVKLLRVLQEKRFYRVGGEKEIAVNVRVVAASNKNLENEVAQGRFREDLFYRLNVAKIIIPPLRDRKEDIPYFAYYFLNEFNQKFDKQITEISKEAIEVMENYGWKGNVRELRNVIERAVLLNDEHEIKEHHLNILNLIAQPETESDRFILKIPQKGIKVEVVLKDLILKTLKITNGNQVKAAKVLGLSRSKLRYRMEQLGIEVTKNVN